MLPDYTIRESARAKHVRFRVTVSDGLVVVIPKGFERQRIPGLLEAKRAWLTRALKEMERHRGAMPLPDQHPPKITLPAVDRVWKLNWVRRAGTRISITEIDQFQLQISGLIQDQEAWQLALKRWLIERGREYLIPWTESLSQELGIHVQRVTVRCQKTRWGSYSTKGTVSLNAQLLLLPRRLARYVLIHELCHAMHPNHSSRFWQLVRQWEPDADRLRAELRSAWRLVPGWLQHGKTTIG